MGIHVKDKELLKSLMDKYTIGEIVDEYLEAGKCSSADILNIADDFWASPEDETPIEKIDGIIDEERRKWYKDPDNNKKVSCEDMMKDIMLVHFDEDEILSCFDADDILDYLDGSWTLDEYVKNNVDEAISENNDEWEKQIEEMEKHMISINNPSNLIKQMSKLTLYGDDVHKLICSLTNNNYYNKDTKTILEDLKELLNKNNYGVKY